MTFNLGEKNMTYLTYLWNMLSDNSGTAAVSLGNMLVVFCFLRPRWKWWLYPILLVITVLALPIVFELGSAWLDASISAGVLLAYLGYWDDILVLISFREDFCKTITLIFTLSILNRMFTFWGYILYIPLNTLSGGKIDIAFSVTLVIATMYLMISFLCWFTLRKKGLELIQTKLRRHNWAMLAGIAVSAKLIIDFCSDHAFELNPYSDIQIIWAMIALCTFVVAVLSLYLYSTVTTLNRSELKAAADRLAFEKEAQQRYYETHLLNQEELRRMKHDMNGHLNTVSRLLAEDNKEEAIRYLSCLGDYVGNHQKELYSDDPYLNAVVTNYATIFSENGTTFEHDIQTGRLEQHHVEMCLVLNNALQNALEASLKLPSEQRFVKLQAKMKQNRLLFRVTNRFDGKLVIDGGVPRSTKENPGHGYGLLSIKDASESLGGFAVCKSKGDMFVLDVAI